MTRRWVLAALLVLGVGGERARAEDDPVPATDRALLEGRIADLGAAARGWRTYLDAATGTPALPTTPVARALWEDRERRETLGVRGLPEEGPLIAPGADARVAEALASGADLQRWLYRPVLAENDPDPEVSGPARAAAQSRLDLRDRALTWTAGSIAALLVLAWLLARTPRASRHP